MDYQTAGKISKGENGEIILNKTCFYAESGGQLGDRGELIGASGKAKVVDTQVPVQGLIVHKVEVLNGSFETGSFCRCRCGSVVPSVRPQKSHSHACLACNTPTTIR